ncbi:hypothetical protein OIU83_11715 [Flavobacterium sp. LS1R49]|uniref:Uncharacterized protein n=1 Tax=Flavobacterium shii TaxID=2987687 RepID=A0A9X2ZIL9_9FLAO|nr:hypothetical protein [Flavobacterium shii]MCV9928328.1 hypothetical protein [Flavobacterium shii]
MKLSFTLLFSGIFILNSNITNAQISTSTGGAGSIFPNSPTSNTNVGIGTTNPTAKLEVVGSLKAEIGDFSKVLPDGANYTDWMDRNKSSRVLNLGTLRDPLDNGRLLCFYDFPQSNVLNLTKSAFSFQIDDRSNHTRFRMTAETGGYTQMVVLNKRQEELMKIYEDGNDNVFAHFPKPNSRVVIGGFGDYLPEHKLVVRESSKIEGNILTDSNIGIGTSNFTDGADIYRLSVKGKIRAEEVKVYSTWADYVFNEDYKLPNLKEVEKYIAVNGHLPNVPSAKDITEKGLELGEMVKIQQEKIEELTLYLIQQNKENEQLNKDIQELKAQMKILFDKKCQN